MVIYEDQYLSHWMTNMLKLYNLLAPHLGANILYSGAVIEKAKYALILIHGRGATADSIQSLSHDLDLRDTIVIAPQADQYTWYPHRFIEKREKNEPGISSGLNLIKEIILSLNYNGILSENIFLLGFSQGACLALDFSARFPNKYGGIFALSGGLIGNKLDKNEYSGSLEETPIFLGCSNMDFHIPENRVHESAEILKDMDANVTKKIYKNLGHTINLDELEIINKIIKHHYLSKI